MALGLKIFPTRVMDYLTEPQPPFEKLVTRFQETHNNVGHCCGIWWPPDTEGKSPLLRT